MYCIRTHKGGNSPPHSDDFCKGNRKLLIENLVEILLSIFTAHCTTSVLPRGIIVKEVGWCNSLKSTETKQIQVRWKYDLTCSRNWVTLLLGNINIQVGQAYIIVLIPILILIVIIQLWYTLRSSTYAGNIPIGGGFYSVTVIIMNRVKYWRTSQSIIDGGPFQWRLTETRTACLTCVCSRGSKQSTAGLLEQIPLTIYVE